MRNPLRVLFIDDSQHDVLLLVRELKRGGYNPVISRVDRPAAMRAALEEPWDLIIADRNMPSFSASAALMVLNDAGADIPFIIVSGVIDEEAAVEMMRAGACDYVSKHNLVRLCAAVERELRETEVRHAKRAADDERRRLHKELQEQH